MGKADTKMWRWSRDDDSIAEMSISASAFEENLSTSSKGFLGIEEYAITWKKGLEMFRTNRMRRIGTATGSRRMKHAWLGEGGALSAHEEQLRLNRHKAQDDRRTIKNHAELIVRGRYGACDGAGTRHVLQSSGDAAPASAANTACPPTRLKNASAATKSARPKSFRIVGVDETAHHGTLADRVEPPQEHPPETLDTLEQVGGLSQAVAAAIRRAQLRPCRASESASSHR